MNDEVRSLRDRLAPRQEALGYYFCDDEAMLESLLEGLLTNKRRYGYMCCPCRLASGDRESDRDIICPCDYREADVAEYGSCYCQLYVTPAWNAGEIPREVVPERRPPSKSGF